MRVQPPLPNMNTLKDLQKFFEDNGVTVVEHGGWFLITKNVTDGRKKDRWSLAFDIFYKNGEAIVEKELVDSFKPKKPAKK